MNIKNMMKFLFPEYQIIESMREYGFILWKKKSEKYSNLSVTKLDGNIINNELIAMYAEPRYVNNREWVKNKFLPKSDGIMHV